MDLQSLIKTRRSVREYTPEMPGEADIYSVLEAGIWAPSGLNNQPWKFMFVGDRDRKNGLGTFTKYGYVIENAPAVICVFLDRERMYDRDKDIMATGACIQNMLLRAHEAGLGTCWLGEILKRKADVREYLGAPEECELMAVITIGYPETKDEAGERREPGSFLL